MAAHNQKWLVSKKISATQGIAAKRVDFYYQIIADIQA